MHEKEQIRLTGKYFLSLKELIQIAMLILLRKLNNYQGGIHPSLYKYINFDSLAYMKDYMEEHEKHIYRIEDGSKHVYVIKP